MRQYFLLLILITNVSCGPTRPTGNLNLVGGTHAVEGEYPSVFIWTTPAENLETSYCSATKVAPNAFLTAAHCVLDQKRISQESRLGAWVINPDIVAGKTLHYTFARDLSRAYDKSSLLIEAVELPPQLAACIRDQRDGEGLCMHGRVPVPDIAVVKVAVLPGKFRTAPAAALYLEPIAAHHKITMMGYGMQDEGLGDTVKPALKFHRSEAATQAKLEEALGGTEADASSKPDFKHFFGSLGALFGPRFANLGSGDSGGPVYVDGKIPAVAGVNSDGYCPKDKLDCERTTNSFFARINRGAPHHVGEWLLRELRLRP